MELYSKNGQTEFTMFDAPNMPKACFLTETRNGQPYTYCFEPSKMSRNEAEAEFQRYLTKV